jgi:hypothetical protein
MFTGQIARTVHRLKSCLLLCAEHRDAWANFKEIPVSDPVDTAGHD